MKTGIAKFSLFCKASLGGTLAGLTFLPAELFAAEEQSMSLKPPVGAVEILSLGTSLILVVGVILLVGWLYARAQGFRGSSGNAISVVASRSLGAKERILVVDVGGTQLVLGMTASNIQALHVLENRIAGQSQTVEGSSFAERFRSVLRGSGK
ncbi:MAG: flagellar biosynthetic protein FliO [Gammaproteobacteria bacterium]|nr:flagellar biosynthetic protein FliO [Gammaproteobacteria bacterium]